MLLNEIPSGSVVELGCGCVAMSFRLFAGQGYHLLVPACEAPHHVPGFEWLCGETETGTLLRQPPRWHMNTPLILTLVEVDEIINALVFPGGPREHDSHSWPASARLEEALDALGWSERYGQVINRFIPEDLSKGLATAKIRALRPVEISVMAALALGYDLTILMEEKTAAQGWLFPCVTKRQHAKLQTSGKITKDTTDRLAAVRSRLNASGKGRPSLLEEGLDTRN